MSQQIQYVKGSIQGVASGGNVLLTDQNNECILPAGVLVRRIILRGENIDGPADLTVGIASIADLFLPSSAGLSSTMLTTDCMYSREGLIEATDDNYVVRLWASDDMPNATIRVVIEYTSFDSY